MPTDVQIEPPVEEEPQDENSYVEELRVYLENAYDLAGRIWGQLL